MKLPELTLGISELHPACPRPRCKRSLACGGAWRRGLLFVTKFIPDLMVGVFFKQTIKGKARKPLVCAL